MARRPIDTPTFTTLSWAPLRDLELDFLEIGLAAGGPEVGGPIERQVASPSAQIWLEYFPLAHIYGFDISDFSHIKHPRFTFVRGDGGTPPRTWNGWETRLRALTSSSMMRLMPPIISSLPSNIYIQGCGAGGTYIIEDLHWQSPAYEGKPIATAEDR